MYPMPPERRGKCACFVESVHRVVSDGAARACACGAVGVHAGCPHADRTSCFSGATATRDFLSVTGSGITEGNEVVCAAAATGRAVSGSRTTACRVAPTRLRHGHPMHDSMDRTIGLTRPTRSVFPPCRLIHGQHKNIAGQRPPHHPPPTPTLMPLAYFTAVPHIESDPATAACSD